MVFFHWVGCPSAASKVIFSKLSMFDEYADTIVAMMSIKSVCSTIILLMLCTMPKKYWDVKKSSFAAIIHYLREVVSGLARGLFRQYQRRMASC